MRALLIAAAAGILGAAALPLSGMAAAGKGRTASGLGSIKFGHDDEGRGTFFFEVASNSEGVSGKIEFAGEGHHHKAMFPDNVIRVTSVTFADIGPHQATFGGEGLMQDGEIVDVEVVITDGRKRGRPDHLSIEAIDDKGHHVFEAEGDVFIGDLKIEAAD